MALAVLDGSMVTVRVLSYNCANGFSLVELIVFMATIGILPALLLSPLGKERPQADRIRCISNLRQLGIAFQSFAHDHNDQFPMQVSTNAGGSKEFLDASRRVAGDVFYFSYRNFEPLASALGSPEILVCPFDTRRPRRGKCSDRRDPAGDCHQCQHVVGHQGRHPHSTGKDTAADTWAEGQARPVTGAAPRTACHCTATGHRSSTRNCSGDAGAGCDVLSVVAAQSGAGDRLFAPSQSEGDLNGSRPEQRGPQPLVLSCRRRL